MSSELALKATSAAPSGGARSHSSAAAVAVLAGREETVEAGVAGEEVAGVVADGKTVVATMADGGS